MMHIIILTVVSYKSKKPPFMFIITLVPIKLKDILLHISKREIVGSS